MPHSDEGDSANDTQSSGYDQADENTLVEIITKYSDMVLKRPQSEPGQNSTMYVFQGSSIVGQASLEVEVGGPSGANRVDYGPLFRRAFLTKFNGPIASSLEAAKTEFTWDQDNNEVSYSDVYLSVLAKKHTAKSNVALVNFWQTPAEAQGED
jgi:hypothetical protein